MPVLGWLAGVKIASLVCQWAPWIATILLAFVGGRMIRSGLDRDGETYARDPSRGGTLILLCLATSIDAFAIGVSLAMLRVDILYPSAVIGVVTAILSLIGLLVGHQLGAGFGKRMEVLGGLLLSGIGLRILLTHLL